MAALLLCTASLATAGEFTELDPRQSSISFVSKQMGVPVEGTFGKFTARVAVDPAKPETGTARIDIDLASIDTGNDDANEEVKGKAWFDIRNHPTAGFISSRVDNVGNGRYEVLGQMTIKGKTMSIRAPFTLTQQAGTLLIEGMFPLRRLDYGIGSGIWSDTDTVADEVQIRFRFTLTKK
ncbi:polyisoprenoid-binding protein [Ferrigenium kumadai]|uniref:Polyisoprenoid-binding protein n=1 Tax=Ferrigenium kumadai TaxID=1682490 RepID=A0AAN1VZZ8_9PROT|nr:YceI family protein [Ferrigenium kumadai]BBI99066.1 polyisoprenoid-binding protein [Ferrigenium kumadai]